MEFFRIKHDIPFMRHARWFNMVSIALFVISVASLSIRGLHLGVDFTGGTMLEIAFAKPVPLEQVRKIVEDMVKEPSVQHFGDLQTVLLRLPADIQTDTLFNEKIVERLEKHFGVAELKRVEFVGPQVGQELVQNGIWAILFVALGIMLYLAFRFEWRFSVATVIANFHDVVIILGLFSIFHWEFNLTTLAAILAVFGYSVNESVVVFDRARENFRKMRKAAVAQIFDNAITRTLSRTIITHGCTLFVVLAMLIFGGSALFSFALALAIGIGFGIYSSALVASPIAIYLGVSHKNLALSEKKKDDKLIV
jgi:preprotein translocase subunit SecF